MQKRGLFVSRRADVKGMGVVNGRLEGLECARVGYGREVPSRFSRRLVGRLLRRPVWFRMQCMRMAVPGQLAA